MVQIAEISEEKAAEESHGDTKETDGDQEQPEKSLDDPQEPESTPAEMAPPDAPAVDASATALTTDPSTSSLNQEAPAAAEAPLYNEYALRVAYIMRSYLYMSHNGPVATASDTAEAPAPAPAGDAGEASTSAPDPVLEERCRAVMEVVRSPTGRWTVVKSEVEHNHPLAPPPDPARSLASLVPVVGMEFESLGIAKAFYETYSEKAGFKSRAGAGRRSRETRTLVMQRFFCSKGGGFPPHKPDPEEITRKRKRAMIYRKIAPKPLKDGEVVEVVPVDSETEKVFAGGVDMEKGYPENGGGSLENDSREKPVGSAVGDLGTAASSGSEGGRWKESGKIPLVSNPGQSRLLRELGIRVSRYSHEERRDIIMKYMKKRNSRQVVDRSIKVPSRQALAERRQRGVGGKFLSKEEMQTTNMQEEMTEEESDVPEEEVVNAGGVPVVGMMFENEDKAYEYYLKYAGSIGFSVRKGWWDKSAKNVTRSRVYVCSREGFRPKNGASEAKKTRPETRTGCSARMAIKITPSNRYRVTEFVPEHNHQLAAPIDIQLLHSERLLAKAQPGGTQTSHLIPADYKNYVRSKRMRGMQIGDAAAVLEYLQKMKGDNPSFYYAIQADEDDKMANVFWADAKSMIDYHYFGDVVCFDTTYKANEYGRPFVLFLGQNHHKQIIIFGAALLYDETVESFKWLFETFKTAMSGKEPKTVLVDECSAISDAVAAVWPGTSQRLSLLHIYQNSVKHLNHVFQALETFPHDFSQCLYDFEEEDQFLSAWNTMLEKYNLKDNEWLAKIFEKRERWAVAFGRQTFCADMENTLRNESLHTVLKESLRTDFDLPHFFKQYEILLETRRYAELQADHHANQGTPRIPPLRLLWQTASAYTPALFDVFRREVELFMDCMIYRGEEDGTLAEYEVTSKDKTKIYFVRFDSSSGAITCSCKKFEFVGIQCCHILKVLDFRNIKELPPQYILKRWRKDAKAGTVRENHEFALQGDPMSFVPQRYSSLCRILYKIAARAAENVEAFTSMVSQSDQILEQVEQILRAKLLEKVSQTSAAKGQQQNVVESGIAGNGISNEVLKASGRKKKDGVVRRRPQGGMEMEKRQKGRNGQSNEVEVPLRDSEQPVGLSSIPTHPRNLSGQFLAPSHFMQGPFVANNQFGLSTIQGFHAMTSFNQDSSASALQQQQHFHAGSHLAQNVVQVYPTPDMHSLQFVASNPQLDPQSSDQGHCAIPVWDFL